MPRIAHSRAVAVAVVALGVFAATAVAPMVRKDPRGDVVGGRGPDVVAVAIFRAPAAIRFKVRFAAAPPLRASRRAHWADMLLIGIDVPPERMRHRPAGWTGVDYFAGLHAGRDSATVVKVSRAGPSAPRRVVARPAVTVTGRSLSFAISRRTLGDPGRIGFVVVAARETSDASDAGGRDEAPDRGVFHVRLRR